MTTKPFGIDRARELLKAALDTQGRDFVYNPEGAGAKCFNSPLAVGYAIRNSRVGRLLVVAEGSPRAKTGCIVGTALSLGGYTHHLTQCKLNAGVEELMYDRRGFKKQVFDNEAAEYFGRAQIQQDMGRTWGEAYDAAEAWYRKNIGETDATAAG